MSSSTFYPTLNYSIIFLRESFVSDPCKHYIHISMADTVFTQSSTCLAVGTVFRCHASKLARPTTHNNIIRFNSKIKNNCFSLPDQSQVFRFQHDPNRKMKMTVYASIPPDVPNPVDLSSHGFWESIIPSSPTDPKVWIFGSIVTAILSLTKGKWGPLLLLRDKIETTIDEVEKVVDVVEEVAEKVDKLAEEVAKNLPEGKLKDAAEFVEKMAEDIDKSAEIAEATLEKVEDMGKKLESFVESTANQEKIVTPVQATDKK